MLLYHAVESQSGLSRGTWVGWEKQTNQWHCAVCRLMQVGAPEVSG